MGGRNYIIRKQWKYRLVAVIRRLGGDVDEHSHRVACAVLAEKSRRQQHLAVLAVGVLEGDREIVQPLVTRQLVAHQVVARRVPVERPGGHAGAGARRQRHRSRHQRLNRSPSPMSGACRPVHSSGEKGETEGT